MAFYYICYCSKPKKINCSSTQIKESSVVFGFCAVIYIYKVFFLENKIIPSMKPACLALKNGQLSCPAEKIDEEAEQCALVSNESFCAAKKTVN